MGVTVAAVVHQPSYEIFAMFDDLLLLCEGGRTAFYGHVSNVQVTSLGFLSSSMVVSATALEPCFTESTPEHCNRPQRPLHFM